MPARDVNITITGDIRDPGRVLTSPSYNSLYPDVTCMREETWRSVTVVENKRSEPHVLQQRVKVYTSGVTEESPGYTRLLPKHRIVPMKELVEL